MLDKANQIQTVKTPKLCTKHVFILMEKQDPCCVPKSIFLVENVHHCAVLLFSAFYNNSAGNLTSPFQFVKFCWLITFTLRGQWLDLNLTFHGDLALITGLLNVATNV